MCCLLVTGVSAASEAKVKELIYGVGFQNLKSKYIKQSTEMIVKVTGMLKHIQPPAYSGIQPPAYSGIQPPAYSDIQPLAYTVALSLGQEHGGKVPRTLEGLLALKGVGMKMALIGMENLIHIYLIFLYMYN